MIQVPQYKEAKLQFLLELVEFDYNLLLLSAVLGHKKFGEVLKTFAGLTIKFPSEAEIKKIAKQVTHYRHSFYKMLRTDSKNLMLKQVAELGQAIGHKDVRQAAKSLLTQMVLEEYLRSLYNDETFKITMSEYDNLDYEDKLKLYELSIQELSKRSTILKTMDSIAKSSQE